MRHHSCRVNTSLCHLMMQDNWPCSTTHVFHAVLRSLTCSQMYVSVRYKKFLTFNKRRVIVYDMIRESSDRVLSRFRKVIRLSWIIWILKKNQNYQFFINYMYPNNVIKGIELENNRIALYFQLNSSPILITNTTHRFGISSDFFLENWIKSFRDCFVFPTE